MKRYATTLLAVVLALTLAGTTGCQRKVEVKTGTRTVCTYGEVISDDTRTIKVSAKDAGKFKVKTVTKTCDTHLKLEALYAAAQGDIASGDLAAAEKKLAEVVAADPTFRKAAVQIADIKAKKKPAADTPTPATPTPAAPATSTAPPEEGPVGPVESLLSWVPDSIPGYTAVGKPGSDALSVSREYVPTSKNGVVMCTIVAEQYRTEAEAQAALTKQVKRQYGGNASSFKVNGRNVYFGTSGRYAVIGFTNDAVMVAVEMMGTTDKPAGLKDELTAVAKSLP